MASQVEIVNVALTRLGADPITSLEDGSTEATIANTCWEVSRRAALRDHFWNFAITEATLNAIDGESTRNYHYKYQLPADCLRLIEVFDVQDYKLLGRSVCTNSSSVSIKYVRDIEDTTEWDAAFVDVFAQRLAAEMAYAITKSQATSDSTLQIYAAKLQRARFVDATEEPQDTLGGAGFIVGARF